jgi:UDP-glucose 4-epimerase
LAGQDFVCNGNDYDTPDGTCIRDYIHVVDLAKAHVKAINFLETRDQGLNEAINIGTGKGTSVLEIIQKFEEISNQKLNWEFGERRAGDVVEIFANARKSLKLLNWKAELTVDDAIKDAWNTPECHPRCKLVCSTNDNKTQFNSQWRQEINFK